MAEAQETGLKIYSIAAHRGFADALVAGLVPRYREPGLGLARVTLLVPSTRAARTLSEAFVRHAGETGERGLLMPRMVAIGDLDLDERLGAALDPLGAEDIPPAVDPDRRWLELERIIAHERSQEGLDPLPSRARLQLARQMAQTMDRLLVEERGPEELISEAVLNTLAGVAEHWTRSIRLFARVQARWLSLLEERGEVDVSTRRNLLFDRAARQWAQNPPRHPVIAAGVTTSAPAVARLLKVIAGLPQGSVVLPDLDLTMDDAAWEELGQAGASAEPDGTVFGSADALTHPQYHLKLLLNRMGVNRAEVMPWHRSGIAAAEPARSRAISSLFLPPGASLAWATLDAGRRRLSGVRLLTSPSIEVEAQSVAMLVREALDEPAKRVAVVTADRGLARRVAQHLARWNITADDTAGQPLSVMPAGRLFGLLADIAANGPGPANLVAAFAHPLVRGRDDDARRAWLRGLRAFDRHLRGLAVAPGIAPLRAEAGEAKVADWFASAEAAIAPLLDWPARISLDSALDRLTMVADDLAGIGMWEREDGRALGCLIEQLRLQASALDTVIDSADVAGILRDVMDCTAVRPAYGGHPRVTIYGLIESRMARADLVICAGLNEGSWPQAVSADPLLAPAVLRTLGVPGGEYRIGLAAHDLAAALGAPQVVLSRALRDAGGPTLPSRFLLRVQALLGEDLAREHTETAIPAMVQQLDRHRPKAADYPRPAPDPAPDQRDVPIKVTALDRLLGDPYQFYAQAILKLRPLAPLVADPFGDPALRGTLVHRILDEWHKAGEPGLALFAADYLAKAPVHPLFRALWQPRLLGAMASFEEWIEAGKKDGRSVLASEIDGEMTYRGVRVMGRADRIDRMGDGTLAIVDYKTGAPPAKKQVLAGYALQLGILGLIARHGRFGPNGKGISGTPTRFEYWSLARAKDKSFGYTETPMREGNARTGLMPDEYLPFHEQRLGFAIDEYIKGRRPFVARENPDYQGYNDYDQLMRLEEWIVRLTEQEGAA